MKKIVKVRICIFIVPIFPIPVAFGRPFHGQVFPFYQLLIRHVKHICIRVEYYFRVTFHRL